MKKLLIITVMLMINYSLLKAQHTQEFTLVYPPTPYSGSLYNQLQFLDSRTDTTQLGAVQTGPLNRKAIVVPSKPLGADLMRMFKHITSLGAESGTLLLQLRQFSFAEATTAMSEKGYCYLRAGLYSQKNDRYYPLKLVDTIITVSSIDVTNMILRKGSEAFTNLLLYNFAKTPADSVSYTLQELTRIDELEKQKLKLYTTTTYTDGVYLTYQSFANQMPDKPVSVNGQVTNAGTVTAPNHKGKMQVVKPQKVYGLVYKGQPYVASQYNFYPVNKINGNFKFTGKAAITANTSSVMLASAFFGVLGALMASNAEATFEMQIDHINGNFIRLREIPQAPTAAASYDDY